MSMGRTAGCLAMTVMTMFSYVRGLVGSSGEEDQFEGYLLRSEEGSYQGVNLRRPVPVRQTSL